MVMYVAVASTSECIAPQVQPFEVLEGFTDKGKISSRYRGYARHTVGTYQGIGDQMPANHIRIEIL
jgi:hypothetical protein